MAVELFYSYAHEDEVFRQELEKFFGRLARRIEIERMAPDVGALFLLRRSGLLAQNVPLDKATQAQRDLAYAIVKEVDGLPLALEQAGAYIEETKCGLDGYLQAYRRQRSILLQRGGSVPNPDYRETVATTWNLSFQKVEAANPAAADLLRLCAFLAPDAIPEEIITEAASELGPTLQPLSDPIQFNDAIQELLKYSLIRRDPSEHTLSLHRLVQIVLLDRMDESTQPMWAERVTRALDATFPEAEFANWPQCKRLLPQTQASAALIEQYQLAFSEAARLLSRAADYLLERGQYTQAQPLYQRTLDIREQVLGPEHRDTGAALNNLARLYMLLGVLYQRQKRYEEAEVLYRRSLAIFEKVFELEHPNVATCLEQYTSLLRETGRVKIERGEIVAKVAKVAKVAMLRMLWVYRCWRFFVAIGENSGNKFRSLCVIMFI
jgi:tetratricopeptide (TPR) repeat protein